MKLLIINLLLTLPIPILINDKLLSYVTEILFCTYMMYAFHVYLRWCRMRISGETLWSYNYAHRGHGYSHCQSDGLTWQMSSMHHSTTCVHVFRSSIIIIKAFEWYVPKCKGDGGRNKERLSPTKRGPVYKCYFWGAEPCARLANRVVSQGEAVCLQRWNRHNGIYKIIRPQLVFFSENKIYHLMSNNKFIQTVTK
jgi:hypothetical protein